MPATRLLVCSGPNLTDRQGDRLIFTSGGTEANNLALIGLTTGLHRAARRSLLAVGSSFRRSSIPALLAAADHLARLGWTVDRLRVNRDGLICL